MRGYVKFKFWTSSFQNVFFNLIDCSIKIPVHVAVCGTSGSSRTRRSRLSWRPRATCRPCTGPCWIRLKFHEGFRSKASIDRVDRSSSIRLVSSQIFLMFTSNAVGHTTLLSPSSYFQGKLVSELENRAAFLADFGKGKNAMLIFNVLIPVECTRRWRRWSLPWPSIVEVRT